MGRPSSLHEGFANVKTIMGLERFEVEKSRIGSCFKSAENRAASSLWVGRHRYVGILCQSKLWWVGSELTLENLASATMSLSDFTILSLEKIAASLA